jgi:GH24 family phage-related lysozyme (muramidase)
MASFEDTMSVYTPKVTEWEGGDQYYDREANTFTAYDDVVGGNIPTLGPGITGTIGGKPIEVGTAYSAEDVRNEYGNRARGDYDWLSQNVPNWDNLNPNQQSSVMSLVHNVGRTGFQDSKAFGHLGAGEFEDFSREAFDPEEGFVRAGEIDPETGRKEVVEGLQNRRDYENELFNTAWESPEDQLVANVTTEQGSGAFNY